MRNIKFNGIDVTNLRYADDAELVVKSRKKLQKMLNKLNVSCKIYGMALDVKKTKVMIVSNSKQEKYDILFDNSILEQVSHYKYLGSWITEDARCEEDTHSFICHLLEEC